MYTGWASRASFAGTVSGRCCLCDTPELWRGAAGLCARVRACAGAAESFALHLVTYTTYRSIIQIQRRRGAAGLCARVRACAGAAESLHTYIVCIHTYIYREGILCVCLEGILEIDNFIIILLHNMHQPNVHPRYVSFRGLGGRCALWRDEEE